MLSMRKKSPQHAEAQAPSQPSSYLPLAAALGQRQLVTSRAGTHTAAKWSRQQPRAEVKTVLPKKPPSFPVDAHDALDAAFSSPPEFEPQRQGSSVDETASPERESLSLRSLLSRQLLVWGPEQQQVLPGSRVLLIGAGAVAVEAAKCLLQSGVGCLLLVDPEAPAPEERAANFALSGHKEQQEIAATTADETAAATSAKNANNSAPCDSSDRFERHQTGLSACLRQLPKQQQRQPMNRARIACAALQHIKAPYARVAEVSLHIRPGETVAAWRRRVENLLQHVDVLLLCDRPLQQNIFFSSVARKLRAQQKVRRGQLEQKQALRGGPLVVAVSTAGLSGRIALDFGNFTFSAVSEEAALASLLHKHAQPQKQERQQEPQTGRLRFCPLSSILFLPESIQQLEPPERRAVHLPADEEQQYLTAAFEALDAAESEGQAVNTDPAQLFGPAAEAGTTAAAAAAGSLRSWSASRIPSARRVAERAASIWRRRYGPTVAATAAAGAAAAARASNQTAVAVKAAAEAAASAALMKGAAVAGRVGGLMAKGSRGHIAPIAAAMGALAAQEALKGLTRKYRPLQGPFVLDALELLELIRHAGFNRGAVRGSRVIGTSINEDSSNSNRSSNKRDLTTSCLSSSAPAVCAAANPDSAGPEGCDSVEVHAKFLPWEGQQQLLGAELQSRLNHLRVLLVGAGAIGCEVLKNFALMGVSTHCKDTHRSNDRFQNCKQNSGGSFIRDTPTKKRRSIISRLLMACRYGLNSVELEEAAITAAQTAASTTARHAASISGVETCQGGLLSLMDGDTVEMSNLSRQVLFTVASLQRPKSVAAAAAALRLCSRVRLQPFPFMLSRHTLWRLPPMYIQEQDLMVAALDSVNARLYVDELCLLHSKPWVEAGTLGLRGHAQSMVPHLTEHYGAATGGVSSSSSAANSSSAVPVCSVRGAPTAPFHAVHWASDQLQQRFRNDIAAAHVLLQQLFEQTMHVPAGASAAGQGLSRADAEAPSPACGAALNSNNTDIQEALRILGMAPAAVAAAAAGKLQLRFLLLLAREILQAQQIKTTETEPQPLEQPQLPFQHQGEQAMARKEVSLLSPTHLRLLSLALSVFGVLFRRVAREKTEGKLSHASDEALGEAVERNCSKQMPMPLDFTDADTLDVVGASGQLLAATLGYEPVAGMTPSLACADASAAAALQQEQEHELLLQGRGTGPWSRQCVASALWHLVQLSQAQARRTSLDSCELLAQTENSASLASLAEALMRDVQAAERGGNYALVAPAELSLSADNAVPLRFLTSAARLRCRAFGLKPLPGPEETQQLIGRIVPATATATTLAAALACLEVYRLVALGLAGSRTSQRLQQQREQQQQKHVRDKRNGLPVIWLDTGTCLNRRTALQSRLQHLRNSFFSLSVPFLAEAPPLEPPTQRFPSGRRCGQPFSAWDFFRLRVRGHTLNSTTESLIGKGVVAGEAEAPEAITVAELVDLIEKDTGVRVVSLTCKEALLYAAPQNGKSLQQQQQSMLPPKIAQLFGVRQRKALINPRMKLAEALRQSLRGATLLANHGQRKEAWVRRQMNQPRQQDGLSWVVVRIAASDSAGAEVTLPPLKVLVRSVQFED
ncbi:ubiquitin-activating enzyme e1, putative [Eimeria tenella]|uniref:Ubiquitin-activating enzyme e1, putative n=1 Tax=Eimeria tenella TaxID=5802 RepID=U6KY85_EIMTE|nr:ubiquitin-activating enzyme e1, putative [Eimeria tenella]CDJ43132.1 ubiquitin-activating enzyme e1, putative [Eimeria tenella]|eukprot:XP_013233882.1 ubiquitin-activating enzyme e1, putative [Eimeria tenella]